MQLLQCLGMPYRKHGRQVCKYVGGHRHQGTPNSPPKSLSLKPKPEAQSQELVDPNYRRTEPIPMHA